MQCVSFETFPLQASTEGWGLGCPRFAHSEWTCEFGHRLSYR